ncbi:MAG TPA: hypothetical protein VJ770_13360, partial [Stellaceae bacterium]|nr:hypothetical protein [Stellaceae bacterium]
ELRPAAQVRPAAELRPSRTDEPHRDKAPVFTIGPAAGERRLHEPRPERPGDHQPEQPRPAARGSALKAGFDAELQRQMEGAIETFRTHLNAALVERSPARCEELRAAASDLMRMTARTLIVLDRLGAAHDQNSGRAPDYPRSAHAR